MTHCNTFFINKIKLADSACPTRLELDEAWTYVKNTDIQYGDLVVFKQNAGYRNEGVVIFDGKKLIDLYADVDDYGSVPPKIKVLQKNKYGVNIGLYHWHNVDGTVRDGVIDHNFIIWFDQRKHTEELVKNLTYDKKLFGVYALYSYLTNDDGQKVYIVIVYQDAVDDDDYINSKTFKLRNKKLASLKRTAIKIFGKKNVPFDCIDNDYYTEDVVKSNLSADKTILYKRLF